MFFVGYTHRLGSGSTPDTTAKIIHMHTLIKGDDNLYSVVFVYPNNRDSVIETGLTCPAALKLVNYLNGGIGHLFGGYAGNKILRRNILNGTN